MVQISDKPFSTFTLKNFTLKNRIGVAPMTRMSGNEDSIPRMDVLKFLERRAQNGASMVFTEALVTDYESSQGYPGQSRITNQKQIDTWRSVVNNIKEHGAMSVVQFFHCGRMAYVGVNPANRVIAPSSVTPQQTNPMTGKAFDIPEEMSQFDIDHVINGFVASAKGAVAAGFDAIEIHGAHGYLINQFLSSYTNKRKDQYGGSLENRFRFAAEIIRRVKEVLPDDKLLFFRISNWGIADMDVSLFNNSQEWKELIGLISSEPVDAISVSTYDFQEKAFETQHTMSQLTRQATELPVFICGKIYNRETVEIALQDADIVLAAKSMLLNANFVEDIKVNKELILFSSDDANIAYTEEPIL